MALTKVTRCKKDYEPFIINLQSLHGKTVSRSCSLPTRRPAVRLRPPERPCPPRRLLPSLGPASVLAPQMYPQD